MLQYDPFPIIHDKVEFVDVTSENWRVIEKLNNSIFDVVYQLPFYKHILHHGKRNFNKLLKYGSTDIGVVLCKHFYLDENLESDMKLPDSYNELLKEHSADGNKSKAKNLESQTNESVEGAEPIIRDAMIYVSAFGLIPMARSKGVGKLMMEHVLKLAEETPGIKYIGLHVHSPNKEALKFYKRHGFNVVHLNENYYSRLQPRSAYFLACFPKASASPEKYV
uniref:N-terminal methionine N(alpha)-acetyltransferase NatE n=1 Tax=Panagrolaimus davidi TaxID=227884 RepID=A0A914P8Q3_9BILA